MTLSSLVTLSLLNPLAMLLIGSGAIRPQASGENSTKSDSTSINRSKTKYAYEMSDRQVQLLLNRMSTISKGSSREEILRKLGKPDVDQAIMPKKHAGLSNVKGRFVRYYLRRVDKRTVNDRLDQSITLYFDNRDKFLDFRFDNIPAEVIEKAGLSKKGP